MGSKWAFYPQRWCIRILINGQAQGFEQVWQRQNSEIEYLSKFVQVKNNTKPVIGSWAAKAHCCTRGYSLWEEGKLEESVWCFGLCSAGKPWVFTFYPGQWWTRMSVLANSKKANARLGQQTENKCSSLTNLSDYLHRDRCGKAFLSGSTGILGSIYVTYATISYPNESQVIILQENLV